jgi:hypothetical protein
LKVGDESLKPWRRVVASGLWPDRLTQGLNLTDNDMRLRKGFFAVLSGMGEAVQTVGVTIGSSMTPMFSIRKNLPPLKLTQTK